MASVLSISVSSLRLDEATDFSASSGHSENQSIVQHVTRLGNCLSLDLKTSPIGLNETITVSPDIILQTHATHTHIHTHRHTDTHMYSHIHTCTPIHICTHINTCIHTCTHNTHTHVCAYTDIHIHTYVHTQLYKHTHKYIHIRTYYVHIIRTYYTYTFIPHTNSKMYIGAYSLSISRKQVSLSRLLSSINHNWLHCIVDVIKILKLINVWYITRVQYIINILQE